MRSHRLTVPLTLLLSLATPPALRASPPSPYPDIVIAHLQGERDEALRLASEHERGMARAREAALRAAEAHDEKHRLSAEAVGEYHRAGYRFACQDRDRLGRALATVRALGLLPAARYRNTIAAISARRGAFEHVRLRAGARVPVAPDEPASLEVGDILRTGRDAVAALTPFDGEGADTSLVLGPGSALEVVPPPSDQPASLPALVLRQGALHFDETPYPDDVGPERTRRIEAIDRFLTQPRPYDQPAPLPLFTSWYHDLVGTLPTRFLVRTSAHVLIPRSAEYLLECPANGPARLTVRDGAALVVNPGTGAAALVEAKTCVRLSPGDWPPAPADHAPALDGWWSRLDGDE